MKKGFSLIVVCFFVTGCCDPELCSHLEAERDFAKNEYWSNYSPYDPDYISDCMNYNELYCMGVE